ncbi:alpha/beta fold hydrolase [Asanoa iriomotensis]|uniref:Alpha/beta hydrolase n=1 Tax=Asanoa iriomotensis TaxID=234613 RepID=A0ABQ4C6C4_9ACTN|nr:alpha/beta hydrolase [Asanoa iriomotensis]GIF58314.1 alpha/beta hydrolase [Asanoa iriomotensis]
MPERIAVTLPDGVRLHVEVSGPSDAPITVFLLHGWTLDTRTWHRQLSGLPEALHTPVRIVAYDARGHGRSDNTTRAGATLAQLGDDLAEVIATVAPTGPIVLAGHSLGGMTIMEFAHGHPLTFAARVAGLVFISTTAEGHTHTEYGLPSRITRLIRLLETTGAGILARGGSWRVHRYLLRALAPSLRWLLFGDRATPDDLILTTAAVARVQLLAIGAFRSSVGEQRRLATLAALGDLPAAALVGDRDRLTPPPCAESIAAALPDADLTVCPGAGHMLMLERPALVTAALAAVTRAALGDQRDSADLQAA